MSKIDSLLEELCPHGVEWKALGDVGSFVRGNGLQKKDFTEHGVGCIHYGQIYTHYATFATQTKSFVSPELAKKLKKARKNDLVIAGVSENVEDVCKAVAWLGEEDICVSGDAFIYKHQQNPKFLAYLFQTPQFFEFKKRHAQGAKVTRLQSGSLPKYIIPVPPLLIQEEIVQILDNFKALEAELKAELKARSAQYEYYRNKLLAFEGEDVEWKALGEVGTFIRGKRFVRTDMIDEGFPCIHYGEMYTHYHVFAKEAKSFLAPELASKLRVANPGDVVIVAAGETIEDIGKGTAWLGETDVVIHDACFSYKSQLNPKYVSYFLRTNLFHDQIKRHISSGKISAINSSGLAKAKIPVPTLAEQERIVTILDQFDALVNDISAGLPAEIAARRQQYEYYRNKLLTFTPHREHVEL